VAFELTEGRSRGFDVPNPEDHSWMKVTDPQATPSEWFATDLGAGEIAAMSLALEHPDHILLLDDALARRTAIAAGLTVLSLREVFGMVMVDDAKEISNGCGVCPAPSYGQGH